MEAEPLSTVGKASMVPASAASPTILESFMLEIGNFVGVRVVLSSLEDFLRTFDGEICLRGRMIETVGLLQKLVRKHQWHQEVFLYFSNSTSLAKGCATAAHCFV